MSVKTLLKIADKFDYEPSLKLMSLAGAFKRSLAQDNLLPEESSPEDAWMVDAPDEASKPWHPPVQIPEVTIEGDPGETGAAMPKEKPFDWGTPKTPPARLAPPVELPKSEHEKEVEPWLVKEQQKRVNYFLKFAK